MDQPLLIVVGLPLSHIARHVEDAVSRYCAEEGIYRDVRVIETDVLPREAREAAALLEEALRRADTIRHFHEARLGVGVCVGPVSVSRRNAYTQRLERVCFDAIVAVGTAAEGMCSWDIRPPACIRDTWDPIRQSAVPHVQQMVTNRGLCGERHMVEVAIRAIGTIAGSLADRLPPETYAAVH